MQYSKDNIIKKLQEIKPVLSEKYKLTELALFGSYARNEATPESDIDIMVLTEKIPFKDYCNMYYFIKENFDGKEIDMVSKNAIQPKYFERLKDSVIYA